MSTIAQFFGAFFILCAIGAIGAIMASERWSSIVLATIGSLSAVLILLASALLLVGDTFFRAELWPVLSLGTMELAADRLSALFLFIAGLVLLPVSIFSGVYLEKYRKHYSLQYFGVLYHALFASIVLILIANDAISFLVSWEIMSIASYLLVNFEYERDESSRAGFMMLAMSEAGTIPVVLAFILAAGASGGFAFDQLRSAGSLSEGIGWAVFLLSFFGFAAKAGLVPVNSWLPLAHPVALGSDCQSRHLRNHAVRLRPATGDGKRPGLDRTDRRQHFRADRNSLCNRSSRDEAPSRAQHDREHGHRRRGNRRRIDVPGERPCCHCRHRLDRGSLSPRQSLGLQGVTLRRNRRR
jgi:hypothetical protein